MASNKRIKGITIEIGGDVTKLDRALNEATKDINKTQAALKDVDRLLKLDPSNVELLDQKQRLLAQAVEQTAERYQTLKQTLEESTASNVRFDEWTQAQSRLQGEITKTSNTLRDLEQEQRKLAEIGFPADSSQMQEIQTKIDATKQKLENLNQQVVDTYNEMGRPISIEQYDNLQRELVESEQAYKQAQQASKNFENGVEESGEAMGTAGEKGGELSNVLGSLGLSGEFLSMAGLAAGATSAIKKFADIVSDAIFDGTSYADNIETLATNYGISTEALQAFSYMSELVDTDINTITSSISRLTRSMEGARDGTGAVSEAFQKLGVPVVDSTGQLRDSYDVFLNVIDALGRIENATERDALSMQIFGRSAMELNSLIAAGSDGIEQYRKDAERLGYILSEETISELSGAKDGFDELSKAMEATKNKIASDLAPALGDLAHGLATVLGLWNTNEEFAQKVNTASSTFSAAVGGNPFQAYRFVFDAKSVMDELRAAGRASQNANLNVNIGFSGSNAAVGAALQPYISKEANRVGTSFASRR